MSLDAGLDSAILSGRMPFHSLISITAVVVVVAGCGSGHVSSDRLAESHPVNALNGLLTFTDPVNSHVYTVGAHGEVHTFLPSVFEFAWSADGRHFAYIAGVNPAGVYVVSTSSRKRTLVRLPPGLMNRLEVGLSLSPRGRTVAISADSEAPNGSIFTVGSNGKGFRQLTHGHDDIEPVWSPDGKMIAFVRDDDSPTIYIMNSDGSEQRRLTSGLAPAWSPDGTMLAFTDGEYAPGDVYTIQVNGKDRAKVAEGAAPVWSPDGTRLAFLCCAANPEDGDRADVIGFNLRDGRRTRLAARVHGDTLGWQALHRT